MAGRTLADLLRQLAPRDGLSVGRLAQVRLFSAAAVRQSEGGELAFQANSADVQA